MVSVYQKIVRRKMHKCICCGRSSVTPENFAALGRYELCSECTDCPYTGDYINALRAGTVTGNNPNCRLA